VELYESVSAKLIRVRDKYLQENECKNCKYWMFCHGGCTFEAVEAFGDINHPYPGCEVRRGLVDYLKITGLKLLKERLIREKRHYRMRIKEKEKFLEGLQENERK
jgi:sulfatase maturation enzyme AslB (radical SAM superfamily)